MTEDLGLFNQFWDEHPRHLPFLSLVQRNIPVKPWDLLTSLKRLDEIMLNNEHEIISPDIELLLHSENWRAHLVAVCAVLKLQKKQQLKFIPTLWKNLQNHSWVNPQIIACLKKIDANFEKNAQDLYAEIETRTEPSQEKLQCLLVYFLEGKIIAEDVFENHATIAQTWLENLAYLMEAGIFSTDQEEVSFPKLPEI